MPIATMRSAHSAAAGLRIRLKAHRAEAIGSDLTTILFAIRLTTLSRAESVIPETGLAVFVRVCRHRIIGPTPKTDQEQYNRA